MSEQMKSLAMVFPGQGSQSLGMLAESLTHPLIHQTLEEANEALRTDLSKIIQQGPIELLNQTEVTQPALLTVSVALWRVWLAETNCRPSVLAGHSLGEYSALVAAGTLDFTDAVRLVAERGKLMQAAVPEGMGAMAAILGLEDQQVELLCHEAASGEVLAAVNYNSPGQVVIAGHRQAVERACVLAKSMGAKRAMPLPVSAPSHCQLMYPAAEGLTQYLSNIPLNVPNIPVIHNADLNLHTDSESIKQALIAQLYQPVRFTQTIEKMVSMGIETIIECGNGKVLSGLMKRINPSLNLYALQQSNQVDGIYHSILEN